MKTRAIAGVLAVALAGLSAPIPASAGAEVVEIGIEAAIERALTEGAEGRLLLSGERDDVLHFEQALANLRWGVNAGVGYSRSAELLRLREGESLDLTPATDQVRGSVSASGGRASVSGSITHSISGSTPGAGGESGDRSHRTSAGISGSYTVYDGFRGGRDSVDREQAMLDADRRRISRESERRDLELDVVRAYAALLGAEDAADVLELSVERRSDELARSEILYEFGEIRRSELIQAEINLLQAEDDLAGALHDRRVASERLALLTGYPRDTRFALQAAEIDPRREVEFEAAVAEALANRSELELHEIRRALGELDAQRLAAERRVKLEVDGGLSGALGWEEETRSIDWNVGLQLSIPVVDPARTVRRERAQAAEAELSLERQRTVEAIRTEVGSVMQQLASAQRRIRVAELQLERVRQEAERARAEYDDGVRSRTEWLAARVEVSNAEIALERSRTDRLMTAIEFDRTLGRR